MCENQRYPGGEGPLNTDEGMRKTRKERNQLQLDGQVGRQRDIRVMPVGRKWPASPQAEQARCTSVCGERCLTAGKHDPDWWLSSGCLLNRWMDGCLLAACSTSSTGPKKAGSRVGATYGQACGLLVSTSKFHVVGVPANTGEAQAPHQHVVLRQQQREQQ